LRKLSNVLLPVFLVGTLAGCAGPKYDDAYYYFSDAPGNGHSRAYMYPTDYTRDYRSYPGDPQISSH
jgi:hypothetical protein